MVIGKDRKISWWTDRKENLVCRYGSYFKIYQRGPDEIKRKKSGGVYWRFKDVDRVRLEFTAKHYHLNKLGIRSLTHFIANPHIEETIYPRMRFVKFKPSRILPCEFDDYNASDNYGNKDCFQLEYMQAKISNPGQYVVDDEDFDDLKMRIWREIKVLEKRWQKAPGASSPRVG